MQFQFIRKRQGMEWKYDVCISTPQTKKIKIGSHTFFAGRRKASLRPGLPLGDNLLKRVEHGGGEE